MVIEQTIEIPVDHRVSFEFLAPRELPPGPARVELKVTPVNEGQYGAAHLGDSNIKQILEERRLKDAGLFTGKSTTPITDRLVGILAGAGDITLEQIREERRLKYMV